MPHKNKFILKSFSWVALSNFITKPFNVLLFILAARVLGTSQYGVYVYALSLVTIVSIIFDFGLDYIAVREISKSSQKLNEYFSEVLLIRLVFFFISLVFFIIYTYLEQSFSSEQSIAILILLFFQFSTIILKYLKSIPSAFHNFDIYSKMMIFEKILVVIFGIAALLTFPNVIRFLLAISVSNIISTIVFVIILINRYRIKFYIPYFDNVKKILKEALPLLTMNIFILAYFRIDVIILNWFTGDKAIVGLYGAIHRVIEMYILIPSILMTTAYPLVSKYIETDAEFVNRFINNILKVLVIVSLPVALVISFNSYEINYILYGSEYIKGSEGLIYLIWAIIPLGLDYVLGNLLISIKKQNHCALGVGLGAATNIILNIIFIPKYSFIGASITTVITESVIFFVYAYFTLKYFPKIKLIQITVKTLSIILMAILVNYLFIQIMGYNLVVNCIFSIVMISVLLLVTNMLNIKDTIGIIKTLK